MVKLKINKKEKGEIMGENLLKISVNGQFLSTEASLFVGALVVLLIVSCIVMIVNRPNDQSGEVDQLLEKNAKLQSEVETHVKNMESLAKEYDLVVAENNDLKIKAYYKLEEGFIILMKHNGHMVADKQRLGAEIRKTTEMSPEVKIAALNDINDDLDAIALGDKPRLEAIFANDTLVQRTEEFLSGGAGGSVEEDTQKEVSEELSPSDIENLDDVSCESTDVIVEERKTASAGDDLSQIENLDKVEDSVTSDEDQKKEKP